MTSPAVNAFVAGNLGGANTTSDNVDLVASLGTPPSGCLMLVLWAMDGTTAPSTSSTGWSVVGVGVGVGGGNGTLYVFAGKEGVASTTLVVTHASEQSAVGAYYITGWSGTVSDVTAAFTGPTSSTNANPPASGTLSGKGDLLCIAAAGWGTGSNYASAGPSGYTFSTSTQRSRTSTASTGASIAFAHKALAGGATSEDPGAFTSTTDSWVAATVLVPAGAGGSAVHGDAALAVSAAGAAGGTRAKHGDASLAPSVALATSGHAGKVASSSLAVAAGRTAGGTVGRHAVAALDVEGSGAAAAHVGGQGGGAATVSADVAGAGHVGKHAVTDLTVTVEVTASGTVQRHGDAALVAVVDILASGSRFAANAGAGHIHAIAAVAADGRVGRHAAAALPVSVTVVASGVVEHHADAQLTVTVQVAAAVHESLEFPTRRTLTAVVDHTLTGGGSSRTLSAGVNRTLTAHYGATLAADPKHTSLEGNLL